MNFEPQCKTIWTWWDTGEESFNDTQRTCINSWTTHNPDWKVTVLSRSNLSDYIDTDSWLHECIPALKGTRYSLRDQAFSDVVKVMILQRYGGVYMDSDVYCNKPFSSWLSSKSDFFTFRVNNVARDYDDPRVNLPRVVDIWFTAAGHAKHYMLNRWLHTMSQYLQQLHPGPTLQLSRDRPDRLITRRYFWAFFCFTGNLYADEKFYRMWCDTLDLDNKPTLWFRHAGHLNPVQLPQHTPPVYKLNRRLDEQYKPMFEHMKKLQVS